MCCDFGNANLKYPSSKLLGSNIGLHTKKSIIKSDSKIKSKKVFK